MQLLIQEAATANKQSHEVRYHNLPSFGLFYKNLIPLQGKSKYYTMLKLQSRYL